MPASQREETSNEDISWSGFFLDMKTWDDQPGGEVVDKRTVDGVDYVLVEFKNSPGKTYLYRAG